MQLRIVALLSIVIGINEPTAWADTVELYGSGQVTGKVLKDEPNGKPPYVLLQLNERLKIAIPKSRVQRVTTADELAAYRANVIKAGVDPEKHFLLAAWCSERKMTQQRNYHMKRTIQLNPDHSKARAALGYVRNDGGEWVLYEQQQRERGLISVGGRWALPEVVAMEQAQKTADVQANKWIKEVARLRSTALRNNTKSAEAYEALKGINDPLAANAIAKELNDSRGKKTQSREMRLLWVKMLGRFRTTPAVRALVRAGIDEPDNVIREAALEELTEYGASSAVATYLPMVKSEKTSSKLVQKALRALSFFPDRELAMDYIDALVTTHKRELAPGPGLQFGAGNGGNGGLAMGGKKKVVVEQVRNPGALTLLKMVEPGVDYGYDEQAWREHFAAQLTTFSGDLRRDP